MNQLRKCTNGLLLLALLALQLAASAQRRGVELAYMGTVTDAAGKAMAGATVSVQENTTASTTTDAAGRFTIQATTTDVLVVRRSGFVTAYLPLDVNTTVSLALTPALINAGDDDDVQIPFGVRKQRYLTAATSQVKADNLPQPLVSGLTSIFAGQLAGLTVLQSSAEPGEDVSSFRVRGRTSFGYANAVVLVDGIRRELSDMDLNEIESVTVLKDAASLSFYGLRGSNGVVLVTTKRGSASKAVVTFDAQYGTQRPNHLPTPLNSYQYATLYNEAFLNDRQNLPQPQTPFYSQAQLDAYQNGTNPSLFPDNNYYDRFIANASPFVRNVLTATGGTSKVRYFALLGYLYQGGIFKSSDVSQADYNSNNGYKRYNFRANIDFDITNSLSVGVYIAGRIENRLNTGSAANGTQAILNSIYNTRPNAYPILNADGSLGGNADFTRNILGNITRNGARRDIQRVSLANITATQKLDVITKGLSFNALLSYDAQGDFTSGFTQNYQTFDLTGPTPKPFGTEADLGYLSSTFTNQLRTNELWLGFDYNRTFAAHDVKATVRGMIAENDNFVDTKQRMQGLSGRVDYAFKGKYLVGFTGSVVGDDDFPPDNRFGFFPAVSAGWIITGENFLRASKTFSFLKLRGSIGIVGNSDLGFGGDDVRRFPYRTYYNRGTTGGYQFGTGFTSTPYAAELNIGNPFITYEMVRMANVGLDFNLFGNTVSGSVDYFRTRRSDILGPAPVSAILGQTTGYVNQGEVKSSGVDASLFYNKGFGAFKLSLNGNLLIAKDEIVAQANQTGLPAYQSSIGTSGGSELYYVSQGFYTSQAEITAGPVSTLAGGRATTYVGDIRYKDVNSDGVIDQFDRVRYDFGNPTVFGFGTVLQFKGFDLNAQFQGVADRKIDTRNIYNTGPNGLNELTLARFTPATASTAVYPRLSLSNTANNNAASDFWVRDANYVKLKTVELGYTFSSNLVRKVWAAGLRLYVSAFNPITVSSLDLDVDPELPFLGRQSGTYPYVRTYAVGIRVKF